jgi:hypothetical protein
VDTETGQAPAEPRPRLWNPRAAGAWGILLSPPIGALLHAANWRALGRPDRAAVSMGWFWCVGVLQVGIVVASFFTPLPSVESSLWRSFNLALMLTWFAYADRQARYVKETLKNEYIRRPWGAPLAAGILYMAAVVFVPWNFSCALYVPAASDLAGEVAVLLGKEWAKNPDIRHSKITAITLVRKAGKEYTGLADAQINGEAVKLSLDVVYDSGTVLFSWRPLEK